MRRLLLLALIGLGTAVSGYLLHRHFALSASGVSGGLDVCSAILGESCDDALRSEWAIQLGLPLAGWGMVYYGSLAALLILGWSLGEAFTFEAHVAGLLLATLAALASIALWLLMISGIAPFCRLCAAVHALNLLLVFVLWRTSAVSMRQLAGALAAAGKYLLGATPADPVASRWKVVGFLAVGLVALVLFQWVYVEVALREARTGGEVDRQQVVASLLAEPVQEIPLNGDDPTLGPDDAPATLVVFNDLQCPACRLFAGEMRRLLERFPEQLRLVFKYFPLDAQCNEAVPKTRYPAACEAAHAAEAARMQGKFWGFYHALLGSDAPLDDEAIEQAARQAGLETEPFQRDRSAQSVATAVETDTALGMRLGVDSTPTLFLNGRRIRDLRTGSLEVAIGYVAASARLPSPKVD